jgi:hypothetical protein
MSPDKPKEFSVATELQFNMRRLVLDFFYSEKTVYFFLGMATEAFGMAIMPTFNLPVYSQFPVGDPLFSAVDFVVGVSIAMILMYVQKRWPRVEYVDDDGDEDDDVESETPVVD